MGTFVFFLLQNLSDAHHFGCAIGEVSPPVDLEGGGRKLQFLFDLR